MTLNVRMNKIKFIKGILYRIISLETNKFNYNKFYNNVELLDKVKKEVEIRNYL